jgi:hypothetical protein
VWDETLPFFSLIHVLTLSRVIVVKIFSALSCSPALARTHKPYAEAKELICRELKMIEQEPERKVVSRTVAIALGIICIVLVVSLVGAIAGYTSMINDKDNTINSLNSQVSNLTHIVNLSNSTIWVNDQFISQSAGTYTYWTGGFSASYAGYISVNILSSTTSNAYAEVIYSSNGVNYDSSVTVGYSGTANFAVLPSGSVQIRVGNTNLINSAGETVTITYYY